MKKGGPICQWPFVIDHWSFFDDLAKSRGLSFLNETAKTRLWIKDPT